MAKFDLVRGYGSVDVGSWQITGLEAGGPGIYLTLRRNVRGKRAGTATFDLRYWYFMKEDGVEQRSEGLRMSYTKHLFDMGQLQQLEEAIALAIAEAKKEGLR